MELHIDLHHTDWQHEVIYPLALIALPMVASVIGAGEWLTTAFPVALLAGFLFTPRHPWLVWLGSVLMMWLVYGSANLLGLLEPLAEDPAQGETIWTFALESFIFMAVLVLLPLWIGRTIQRAVSKHDRPPG
jgi:hypothetical protein